MRAEMRPAGTVKMRAIRGPGNRGLLSLLAQANPLARDLEPEVRRWRWRNLHRTIPVWFKIVLGSFIARRAGLMHAYGALFLTVTKADGRRIQYGLASLRVVTTVGVGFIVDAFQNSVELETMKYHGIGTGTTAAAVGDTGIETELTTQYTSDNTRATGTTTEGASANIYRTVGTNEVDATVAITEHGILSNATVGSGVLLDRHVFSAVNLVSGDSLQSTYDLTVSAGG